MTTTPVFPKDPTQIAETDGVPVQVADGGVASSGSNVAGYSAGYSFVSQRVPVRHEIHHGVPEAASSLLMTIIVALFVLTFVVQPMVIPSESMERTLLVGDFLLVN